MRKGLLAGLAGLISVTAISCGPDEDNPTLEVPDTVFSTSTAMAVRVTGPFDLNSPAVLTSLSRMANDRLTFTDLITRGGVPDAITANPAGTSLDQLQAFIDNGGPLAPEDSVDLCGNPMVASFITPDMAQEVYDEPLSQAIWPGVCGDDLDCDTSSQGLFEVSFSQDHGGRDLVVRMSAVAGPTTTMGYTGHLLGYFLTPNTTGQHLAATSVWGNIRNLTISAFGLVEFAKAGVSTRPSLPIPLPTQVWAFPAGERELAAADLVVAAEANGECAKTWAQSFAGREPFGCDQAKALVLDTTSQAGQSLFEGIDEGDDIEKSQALAADLDDVIKAFNHQLKAQLVCPDVTSDAWERVDLGLGSVEFFQCPTGEIDSCIAYHDREDFFCELPFATELEPVELESEIAVIDTGDAGPFTGVFDAHDPDGPDGPQTVQYSINGTTYTLEWLLEQTSTQSDESPLTLSEVVAHLNAQEAARASADGDEVHVLFSEGETGILVEPAHDIGPIGDLSLGGGEVNSQIGLTGSASYSNAVITPGAEMVYDVTAINADLDTAYVEFDATGADAIYTAQPDRILGLFDSNGNELAFPTPRADSHCPGQGQVVFPISESGTVHLQLDMSTDGADMITLIPAAIADYE